MTILKTINKREIKRQFIAFFSIAVFAFNTLLSPIDIVRAQELLNLPQPGVRVGLSPIFNPPVLKGIKVYPNDPFRFDFILDTGDTNEPDKQLKADSTRLIKYFLASLTTPEKDLWVNLSPYEKNRIVPEAFGQTEMGRDLLAQDYMLKQITASIIYPYGKVGKDFWDKVYAEAFKRYGKTDIPVNTFNKVWIIPEKATVYENKNSAIVVESRLKVMLEEDYVALNKSTVKKEQNTPATNKLGSDIVRQVVIPLLDKEVNEGRNFAPLRQVYQSLILATWYKRKVRESILGQAYDDKNKTTGIDIVDKNEKEKIWQLYVKAFKKGAYNFIKEEYDPATQATIPRKYFSGGTDLAMTGVFKAMGSSLLPNISSKRAKVVQMRLDMAMNTVDNTPIPKSAETKLNRAGRYNDFLSWFSVNPYLPIKNLGHSAVVDIGSSYGYATVDLAKLLLEQNPDVHVYGVDIGEHVGQIQEDASLPENLKFIQDDHRLLKKEIKEPIMVMSMFNVLRHYGWEQASKMVEEMAANLSEGGLLILGDGNNEGPYRLQFIVLQKVSGELVPQELVLKMFSAISDTVRLNWCTAYMPERWKSSFRPTLKIIAERMDDITMKVLRKYHDGLLGKIINDTNTLEDVVLQEQVKDLQGQGFVVHGDFQHGPISLPLQTMIAPKNAAAEETNTPILPSETSDTSHPKQPSAPTDKVMVKNGGIDLNPDKLEVKTLNNGEIIKLNLDAAMLHRMQRANGVNPVIIGILPLENLKEFLGVQN